MLISSGKLASGRYSIEEIVRDAAIGFVGGKVLTHAVGAFNKYKAGRSFKGTRNAARGVSEMYEHVYKVGSYKEMKRLTSGYKGEIQAHHILEQRHAKHWRLGNTNDMPAVILTRKEHEMIGNILQQKLSYKNFHTKREVWDAYQEAYKHRPEWLDAIRKYFK